MQVIVYLVYAVIASNPVLQAVATMSDEVRSPKRHAVALLEKMSGKAVTTQSNKRLEYLEWPDYFMAIAFLSAQRSKDPSTQVGACIVNEEKKIVGIGYNGMPNGCDDDILPWARSADNSLDTKYPYVCHAELNAILNKNAADVKNCSIYVALFPCNECAKLIIQSGIKHVIYMSDKYSELKEFRASRRLLDLARVSCQQMHPKQSHIVIDFLARNAVIRPMMPLSEISANTGQVSPAKKGKIDGSLDRDVTKDDTATLLNHKRTDYIEWNEYFMAIALLSAQRSKDPVTQVGACIVNDEKKIVAIGYNGMPNGCDDDILPWGKSDDDPLCTKYPYVCHAELNAILNKNSADVKDCIMHVTMFPCNECAKLIIQSRIKHIVYIVDKNPQRMEFQASKRLLTLAKVTYSQYKCNKTSQIVIDFGNMSKGTKK